MNKYQAVELMKKGARLTHSLFSSEEWIEDREGKFVFEDGCSCEYQDFWSDRGSSAWLLGWSLIYTPRPVTRPVKYADYPISHKAEQWPEAGNKICICVWPDGSWCAADEINEYDWKSDDYLEISVDAGLDEEQVGTLVMSRYNPGQSTSHPEEHS